MRGFRYLWMVLGFSLLGCGTSSEPQDDASAALCLNSDCGTPRQIVDLPDLENILVTRAGRVLVTGQENLYEILRQPDGSYSASPFFAGTSGCSGITESASLAYVLCQGPGGATDFSGLSVLDLGDPAAVPEPIFSLTGMSLPNGMVPGPGNTLFVTDGPVAAEPKIVRLTLDPSNPRSVLSQDTWLLTAPDYPNGLEIIGRYLYTTLYNPGVGGSVARIEILADGSAGPVEVLHPRGIMDDLNVFADSLLVTDWENGQLFQINLAGGLIQETLPGSFAQPSSVDVGGPPLFDQPVALVTERYSGRGLWVVERNP